jgi:hypothetical protein
MINGRHGPATELAEETCTSNAVWIRIASFAREGPRGNADRYRVAPKPTYALAGASGPENRRPPRRFGQQRKRVEATDRACFAESPSGVELEDRASFWASSRVELVIRFGGERHTQRPRSRRAQWYAVEPRNAVSKFVCSRRSTGVNAHRAGSFPTSEADNRLIISHLSHPCSRDIGGTDPRRRTKNDVS